MRKNVFEYTVPSIEGCAQAPSLRTLQLQEDGTLWGGFLFSSAPLQRFEWDAKDGNVVSVESEGIEKILGDDSIGIWAGLRPSSTGDTVFTAWHRGSVPSFLNFFGSDLRKADTAMIGNLIRKDGGTSTIRHSIIERNRGEWHVRRGKEPGVLSDVAIIGDYVFGLTPRAVFREPYLKTEKREVLRSDLQGNFSLNRDSAGTFWFQSQNGRLMRMGLTDLKPKLTPLKVAGEELGGGESCAVDGWIYALTQGGKQLVRLRMNPITLEEEIQVVSEFEGRADAMHMINHEKSAKLAVAESFGGQGTRVLVYNLGPMEDPEMIGAPPTFEVATQFEGIPRIAAMASKVQSLDGEEPRDILWLATSPQPGSDGREKLQIISLIDV
ncbi:MAG TPA: hypothetical protein VM901_03450 [Bdellovibrionota bacterium]|jgi:hypothetical protein|nr:hypothetical protein [Bdellovibrionota bacterium]